MDKAAANRFIKYAIAQVKSQRPPGDGEGAGPSHVRFGENGEATKVPVKVTSKMAARAQYEKELAEIASDEEEETLEAIGIDEPSDVMDVDASKDKGKGKAVEVTTEEASLPGRKRRRPVMDPFAGMCHLELVPSSSKMVAGYDKSDAVQDTKKAKASTEDVKTGDSTPADSGRSTPLSSSEATKKAKKAERKARKKAKQKDPGA